MDRLKVPPTKSSSPSAPQNDCLRSEFAGDDLESGKVFEIDVNETLPERSIILIHDTEYPQSIASKAFQKFLAERKEQNR